MRERLVRVEPDGSITLPEEMLFVLGLRDGGEVLVREEGGRVVLERAAAAARDGEERRGERWGRPPPAARVWSPPNQVNEEEG